MKDCYEIIGAAREAIEWSFTKKQRRTYDEQDEFVKSKYNRTIKILEFGKKMNTNPKKRELIEKQIYEVKNAYRKIKTPILREIYNQELDELKRKERGERLVNKNAYEILNTTRDALKMRVEERNDELLKSKKDELIKRYLEMITSTTTFSEKQKIDLKINQIKESYNLVKTADRRKIYNEKLDLEEEARRIRLRKEEIRRKYSHEEEKDPSLIYTNKNSVKAIKKIKNKASQIYFLIDKQGREIILKRTAEIIYRNSTQVYDGYVNEYELERNVNGVEKIDKVYTNILLRELSFDEETGKPENPEYYDCVVNELLSEDSIEGSKYNGGYIGNIERTKDGKYTITLDKKELNAEEQEMLTAVMLLKDREDRISKKSRKNRKEESR